MDLAHRLRIVFLDGDDRENAAYSGWTEYDFKQNIQEVPYTGTLTLKAVAPGDPTYLALITKLRRNPRIALMVDGTKRATCRVRDMEQSCSRSRGQVLVVSTEDLLGQPFRNALPLDFSLEGLTVKQIGEKLLGPFGLSVVADDRANRVAITTRMLSRPEVWDELTPDEQSRMIAADPELAHVLRANADEHQANPEIEEHLFRDGAARTFAVSRLTETKESRAIHPQPGQKIGEWYSAFLREHGLMIWADAAGNAILSTPDYTAPAEFYIELLLSGGQTWEGTILESRLVEQPGAQVTEAQVYGHSGVVGDDDRYGSAVDTELEARGYKQLDVQVDASCRDGTSAKRRAETTLREAQMASWVYSATIAGHSAGLLMPAPNMRIRVRDESIWLDDACLDEVLHCISVGFGYRRGGPTCTVELIRPGLWTT